VKDLLGAPLWGRTLALPTNIRLGRESLPGTNTQASYENALITAIKTFIAQALGVNCLKTFYVLNLRMGLIYKWAL
jgi:hypothetical protein